MQPHPVSLFLLLVKCFSFQYVAWHFLPSVGRWTQQPGGVKRRYREFTTLQDRLQDHPVYKKSIKSEKLIMNIKQF